MFPMGQRLQSCYCRLFGAASKQAAASVQCAGCVGGELLTVVPSSCCWLLTTVIPCCCCYRNLQQQQQPAIPDLSFNLRPPVLLHRWQVYPPAREDKTLSSSQRGQNFFLQPERTKLLLKVYSRAQWEIHICIHPYMHVSISKWFLIFFSSNEIFIIGVPFL